MYIRKIRKIGNSWAVTIPKKLVDEYGLKAGDLVDKIYIPERNAMLIQKHVDIKQSQKYSVRAKK